jgi:hypothetical protein
MRGGIVHEKTSSALVGLGFWCVREVDPPRALRRVFFADTKPSVRPHFHK